MLVDQTKIDMTILTVMKMYRVEPNLRQVNTYDEDAYCALVPIPLHVNFLQFALAPFDSMTWLLVFISIISCALLAKLLDGISICKFFRTVAASFVFQSLRLECRKKWVMTLLQLCFVMTFVLGNVYQSTVIAALSAETQGSRIFTFQELLASGLSVKSDAFFYKNLKEVDAKSTENLTPIKELDIKEFSSSVSALIGMCDFIEIIYDEQIYVDLTKNFYFLPERILKSCIKFHLSLGTPFYFLLQGFFDLTFEAGIRHYWAAKFKRRKEAKISREKIFVENEPHFLNLNELCEIFYILIIGWSFGTLAFVFECLKTYCAQNNYLHILKPGKMCRK